MDPDRAFYPYGWGFPYLGLDDGPDYLQEQQAIAMGSSIVDPEPLREALGPEYAGPILGQERYFGAPMMGEQPQLAALSEDHPLGYGAGGFMGPHTDAFLEERGLPPPYGGAAGPPMLYGNPGMPYAQEGSGFNALDGVAYDGGMPVRTRNQDFPTRPGYLPDVYAGLNGRRDDVALSMGLIGDRPDNAFARHQMPARGARESILEPYGPDIVDYPPAEFTSDQFMEEQLPMDPAWHRNMFMQPPRTLEDPRLVDAGPMYEPPSILEEKERRVRFG